MDTQAQHILAEALKLPADAREDLAVRLMGSVEPTQAEAKTVRQAWIEEVDRRVASLESGETTAIPIEDAWPGITGKPWQSKSPDNG
ncbi:MAG: addiction module protein [Pirellulales bacterium]|nr:addiction module protein [Pirellulales bacterium]